MPDIDAIHARIDDDPEDLTARLVLADALEESDDPALAELAPGYREMVRQGRYCYAWPECWFTWWNAGGPGDYGYAEALARDSRNVPAAAYARLTRDFSSTDTERAAPFAGEDRPRMRSKWRDYPTRREAEDDLARALVAAGLAAPTEETPHAPAPARRDRAQAARHRPGPPADVL